MPYDYLKSRGVSLQRKIMEYVVCRVRGHINIHLAIDRRSYNVPACGMQMATTKTGSLQKLIVIHGEIDRFS